MAKLKSIFNSPIYKGVCIGIITTMAIGTFSGIVLLKIDSAVQNKAILGMQENFSEFKLVTNYTLNKHDQKIDGLTVDVTAIKVRHKYVDLIKKENGP